MRKIYHFVIWNMFETPLHKLQYMVLKGAKVQLFIQSTRVSSMWNTLPLLLKLIHKHVRLTTALLRPTRSYCGNVTSVTFQLGRQSERQYPEDRKRDTSVYQSPDSILWPDAQSPGPWSVVLIGLPTPWNGVSVHNCKYSACRTVCLWLYFHEFGIFTLLCMRMQVFGWVGVGAYGIMGVGGVWWKRSGGLYRWSVPSGTAGSHYPAVEYHTQPHCPALLPLPLTLPPCLF